MGVVLEALACAWAALKRQQWCSIWPGMPQKLQPSELLVGEGIDAIS
jgi:hypothetical protein